MPDTDRLILRPARRADIPALFAFLGDAEAMRHTQCDRTLQDCRRRVMVHEWRRRHDGCAPWVVVRREDSRIVGWGGLYHDPFDHGWGLEVGYYFHPDAWGRGYASELVGAALRVADHDLEAPDVIATAHPDNRGSQRVLTKAGFVFVQHLPQISRLMFRRLRP